jgi:hypothetical protein
LCENHDYVNSNLLTLRAAAPRAAATDDIGRFKLGAAAGEERAGFSGLAKLQVFANASDPDWETVSAMLTAPEVEAELGFFTPILVDPAADVAAESRLRQRDGLQVIVRALNGKFLGGLRRGFTRGELVDLLAGIRRETIIQHPARDEPDLRAARGDGRADHAAQSRRQERQSGALRRAFARVRRAGERGGSGGRSGAGGVVGSWVRNG